MFQWNWLYVLLGSAGLLFVVLVHVDDSSRSVNPWKTCSDCGTARMTFPFLKKYGLAPKLCLDSVRKHRKYTSNLMMSAVSCPGPCCRVVGDLDRC